MGRDAACPEPGDDELGGDAHDVDPRGFFAAVAPSHLSKGVRPSSPPIGEPPKNGEIACGEEKGVGRMLQHPPNTSDHVHGMRSRAGVLLRAEEAKTAPRAARRVGDHGEVAGVGPRVARLVVPLAHEPGVGAARVDVERDNVVANHDRHPQNADRKVRSSSASTWP